VGGREGARRRKRENTNESLLITGVRNVSKENVFSEHQTRP
jgi:hypothetical protein